MKFKYGFICIILLLMLTGCSKESSLKNQENTRYFEDAT